jgi:hypothetical protein
LAVDPAAIASRFSACRPGPDRITDRIGSQNASDRKTHRIAKRIGSRNASDRETHRIAKRIGSQNALQTDPSVICRARKNHDRARRGPAASRRPHPRPHLRTHLHLCSARLCA